MPRPAFSEVEWNGKSVLELDHAELLQLADRLHSQLWDSIENFETLVARNFPQQTVAGRC